MKVTPNSSWVTLDYETTEQRAFVGLVVIPPINESGDLYLEIGIGPVASEVVFGRVYIDVPCIAVPIPFDVRLDIALAINKERIAVRSIPTALGLTKDFDVCAIVVSYTQEGLR